MFGERRPNGMTMPWAQASREMLPHSQRKSCYQKKADHTTFNEILALENIVDQMDVLSIIDGIPKYSWGMMYDGTSLGKAMTNTITAMVFNKNTKLDCIPNSCAGVSMTLIDDGVTLKKHKL